MSKVADKNLKHRNFFEIPNATRKLVARPQAELNLYRIVDANFNRAKEGLRVCEDICRFLHNRKVATRKYKDIRHRLTEAIAKRHIVKIIQARDIKGDVGRKSSLAEFRRSNADDIFYANSQRVKESLRVLEEFTKLVDRKASQDIKRLRYETYALEKEIVRL